MIAHENRILWLPGEERSWDDDGGGRSPAGVRISPENATAVAAVFSCARILAETVASLPLHILERLETGGKRQARELPLYKRLHSQPNSWQTSFEWREQAVFHVCLWGDAYSEIRSGSSGAVDQLIPLHPSRMKVETLENGSLRYTYREAKGRQTIYTDEQILHLRGPSDDGVHGMSIIEECREAIALARACEIHGSRFFGAGARPGFILSTDNPLNADARRELADNWNRKHRGPQNAFETAVLTGGLKPYEIPYATNTDSQFLELRQYQLAEIARLFRVPMHLLGVMNGGYGSIEHAGLDFVQHTILPWLRRFESAFTRDLITDDEKYFVEFDVRGLLRGDSASRSQYYRAMWDIGALSTNDILELENRNPVEGGDVRYRPLNMGTLGQDPTVADAAAQQQPGSGIDGQAVEGASSAQQLADAALNGTQVAGIMQILQQIASGFLSKTAAAALIAAAYPNFKPEQISAMVGGIDETAPPPVPEPKPAAGRSLPQERAWCPTGPGGGQDNSCSSKVGGGGGGSGGDGSGGSGGGEISSVREKHAKEREAWKAEKKQAAKELSRQERKDTARLDRQYERELSAKIDAAGEAHDKETSAKVREVTKKYKSQIKAAGSDANRVVSLMHEQKAETDSIREAQGKAWREKQQVIKSSHDEEYGAKYDALRELYDSKREELSDRFDAKREEIQAKHDAEREQLLKKRKRG